MCVTHFVIYFVGFPWSILFNLLSMTDGEHSFNAGLGTVRNVVDKVLGSHHVQRPMEIPDPPIFPLPCLCIKGYPGMLTFLFLEYLALSRNQYWQGGIDLFLRLLTRFQQSILPTYEPMIDNEMFFVFYFWSVVDVDHVFKWMWNPQTWKRTKSPWN
jgi:hypothetical protein